MRVCATVAVLSGACSAFSRTLGPRAAISRCSVAEPAEAAAADAAVAEKEPLLLRMARGEKVERAPVWMMRQAGRHMQVYRDLVKKYPTFRERSEIPEASLEISLQPWRAYGVDGVIMFSDILTPLPAMNVEFDISEGGAIKIVPVRTQADLDKLQRLDVTTACPFVGTVLRQLRETVGNSATVLGFVGLPFTLATYLVEGKTGTTSNFAEVRKMRETDPALLHGILSLLADNIGDYACYQISSGAQVIQIFDSWAGHLTEEEYRTFALPYQQRVVAAIKKMHPTTPVIIYMAPDEYSKDGKLLHLFGESGADIVSVDHTIELSQARAMVPEHLGLQGNLDPHILSKGTHAEIEAACTDILTQGGLHKHIMNLGHGIEADTPEENAKFFVDFVQNFKLP